MANKFITALFGDYSKKEVKRLGKTKQKVLDLEEKYQAMDDKELTAQTAVLKTRLADGETLDDILPDAFAVCREAAWRVLGMKHFPVQIVGGIVLHQGRIAEMKTGEGKTLVATLPAYLNALTGRGVHIVTVNDYLAKRDSEWMGKLYRFLGLSVGLIIHEKTNEERQEAYNCDITYGTNNEMGFDYLRDNMVQYKEQKVQRGHVFAIVDEVDSILIDEARTPLIISGKGEQSTDLYRQANAFARTLKMVKVAKMDEKQDTEATYDGDFIVDEKARTATLTQDGVKKAEAYFHVDNLMDIENTTLLHHIDQAIKAIGVMRRDIDYVVKDGQVLIVDEFTGRIMLGRRYNEGLHQAIEAKEGVKVEHESKTLATITFQNYFRLYEKLSGMTGTASTESAEFSEIYKLDVVEIPTNKPLIRVDHPDVIFQTEAGKFRAVIKQIKACHEKGQPVLVGTISIEKSEQLSKLLKKEHIQHNVLNAKNHEREAEIIAQAGKFGAVTISTNMAGRGTDIMLGGNAEFLAKAEMKRMQFSDELIAEATGFAETDNQEILNARKTFQDLEKKYKEEIQEEADKVREAGGLYILGTERHDSRRIDNQLRGRAGRQGDPGETRFYISLEDDLMRLFGGDKMDRVSKMMVTADMGDDMPIQHKIISKAVENAQHKVESINFSMRKSVLEYDDVMNKQRQVIYAERNKILDGKDLTDHITEVMHDTVYRCVQEFCTKDSHDGERDLEGLRKWVVELTGHIDTPKFPDEDFEALAADVLAYVEKCYNMKAERLGEDLMRELNTQVMLRVIDTRWMNYLQEMDYLKTGIGLRGFGQRDPLVEYKTEAYGAFQMLVDTMYEDYLRTVLRIEIKAAPQAVEHKEDPALEGARFSGPADVDGDNGSSVLRKQAQVQARTAVQGGPAAVNNGGKVTTYRKSESDDPYVNVGRNDPCPCGSGKKFKYCHGRNR